MKRKSRDVVAMQILVHTILIALVIATLIPMMLTIIISFTDQASLMSQGYRFFPESWSTDAYRYLLRSPRQLLNGYKNSILITAVGTVLNLGLTALIAYPLSRPDFAYRRFFNTFVFIPMLFSGGMVASYLLIVKYLGWKNNLLSVIIPGMCAPFHVFLLRVLFQEIPFSLQEAARIDGASERVTFVRIVLPLSKSALATVGLQYILGYWNNTTEAQLYLIDSKKYPITLVLNNIVTVIEDMKKMLLDPSLAGGNQIKAEDIPSDGIMYALMVVATVPLLLVFTCLQKYFVKGMIAGAVKE